MSYALQTSVWRFAALSLVAVLLLPSGTASAARFWVSLSATDPMAGIGTMGSAQVNLPGGSADQPGPPQNLTIWVQPSPDNGGFKQLQNISLNIVTEMPVVDITDVLVIDPNGDRFARIVDSSFHDELNTDLGLENRTANDIREDGQPDHVLGLLASAGLALQPGAGIGPDCSSDPMCTVVADLGPAWPFASFRLAALSERGETDLFLEIGARGINHVDEFSVQTNITFAPPGIVESPQYNAGPSGDRQKHDLAGEITDVHITVMAQRPGDYNGNGSVEQGDLDLVLLNWGQPVSGLPETWVNERPTSGMIDQAELDGVLLSWGNAAADLGVTAVPEPASLHLLFVASVTSGFCIALSSTALRIHDAVL